jgi:hypothetical protein
MLMANIIDRLNVERSAKLGMYVRVAREIESRIPTRGLVELSEGLFLRLLKNLSSSDQLSQWVREYEVLSPSSQTLTFGPQRPAGQLVELRKVKLQPRDYCEAVVSAVQKLPMDERRKLAFGPQLRAYHGVLLHCLGESPPAVARAREVVRDMVLIFTKDTLVKPLRDVAAALLMWEPASKAPGETLLLLDEMLDAVTEATSGTDKAAFWSVCIAAGTRAGWRYPRRQALLGQLQEIAAPNSTSAFAASYAGAYPFRRSRSSLPLDRRAGHVVAAQRGPAVLARAPRSRRASAAVLRCRRPRSAPRARRRAAAAPRSARG